MLRSRARNMAARMAFSACPSGVVDIVCGTLQAKLFTKDLSSGSSRCIQYGSVMPQMVPPKWVPRTICGKLCCYGWSPRTKYGCHRWSPRTIYGAVSGPPLPQMVPLKLSLEMMSRGSYEVNLANMDRVIIIIIYFSLCMHCFMQ